MNRPRKCEALRVRKRRLVRVVFNLLHADLDQARLDEPAPSLRRTNRPLMADGG
jgi:hypothetical protein